jgi:hypothetical protein
MFNRKTFSKFFTKNFFLFQVFDFWFFTKIFILQQCLNPNPNLFLRIRIRIQPKHTDYFVFGFGSTTLLICNAVKKSCNNAHHWSLIITYWYAKFVWIVVTFTNFWEKNLFRQKSITKYGHLMVRCIRRLSCYFTHDEFVPSLRLSGTRAATRSKAWHDEYSTLLQCIYKFFWV